MGPLRSFNTNRTAVTQGARAIACSPCSQRFHRGGWKREKKYGFAVQHRFDLLQNQQQLKHMEMVAWLKEEHEISHGHANALVAYFRSQTLE